MIDRKGIEKLLIGSAVRPELTTVDLPVCGETFTLRRPNREQATRVVVAAGNDEDMQARVLVGVLRFALVDDAGEPLLRSFAEASQLFNALPDEDLTVLMPELMALLDTTATSQPTEAEGKAR